MTVTLHFFKTDIILAYLLHWSCTLFQFTLEELPACMRNIQVHVMFLVHGGDTGIPVRTGQEFLYLHILVRTGTYQYIPVHTILPDPVTVQVCRIPDAVCPSLPARALFPSGCHFSSSVT
jgi:hypothetical protein